MTTQHIETLIIGAGQAGLSTAYHLKQRDGQQPGRIPFPGDPWAFPSKDEFAAYLELYAVEHDLPVRMRTRVDRLTASEGSGFTATLGVEEVTCNNVVVAKRQTVEIQVTHVGPDLQFATAEVAKSIGEGSPAPEAAAG